MSRTGSNVMILAGIASLTFAPALALTAQGITGASLEGTTRRADKTVIDRALVILRDSAMGSIRTAITGPDGRYRFENAAPGTYRLEVRSAGNRPLSIAWIRLRLGDHARLDLEMAASAQPLGDVIVRTESLRDAGAGGPAQSLTRESIRRLMLLDRDFVGLLAQSTQATGPGSLWIGGQHSRFNAIQVDGASASDFFGLNVTPGSSSGGKSIPLEAIEEVRILTAPFDVRQGGFSGGLINALTKSGSNRFHASVFTSLSRSELVGEDSAGSTVPTFRQLQYGLSAGGPVVRDKLHYFGVAEIQTKQTRSPGPSVSDPATGITEATVRRARSAFAERFGFEAGGSDTPELQKPTGNLMAKLSWHPSANQSIDVTPFISWSRSEEVNRQVRNLSNGDAWQLSNSGQILRNSTRGLRLKSVTSRARISNEAILSVTSISDRLDSRHEVPLFVVQADVPNTFVSAGSTKGGQGTGTSQRILEVTDNLTHTRGNHVLTLGTQNWIVRVTDNFISGAWGVWTFSSVDSLQHGSASRYELSLPLRDQPLTAFWSLLGAAYIQDQWRAHERLWITAGVRLEAPFFQSPHRNQQLTDNAAVGRIDTGRFPSGNLIIAPRLGFSWTAGARGKLLIRGGAGVFTGRTPLVWLTNAFANTGDDQVLVVCTRAEGVPAPTANLEELPRQCTGGSSRSAASPSVTIFDHAFRPHQAVKYALGADFELGYHWSMSVDFGRVATRDHTALTDRNLVDRGRNSEQRTMYGSITATGESRPTRLDSTSIGPVYEFANDSKDRSMSATIALRRDWMSGVILHGGYTWSRTQDAMSAAGFSSVVSFRNNPIDGSLADRALRRSARDIPHNFVGTAVVPVGRGVIASLRMRARSGAPYAFTVNGDANADGAPRNDLIYVPRSAEDIDLGNPSTYAALDAFIETMPCLNRQRGSIIRRNSCRNPPVTTFDTKLTKRFQFRGGKGAEIFADVFNIPNLLNRHWGIVRETTAREDVPLMIVTGWNSSANRPRYSIPQLNGVALLPPIEKIELDVSRWRVQAGARYEF